MAFVTDAPTVRLVRVLSVGVCDTNPDRPGRGLKHHEVFSPRIKGRVRRCGECIQDVVHNRRWVVEDVQAAARIARCVRLVDAYLQLGARCQVDIGLHRRQRVPIRVARGESQCHRPLVRTRNAHAQARGAARPGVRDQGLYRLRLGLKRQGQERGDGHEEPRRVAGHRTCARQRRRQAGRAFSGNAGGPARDGTGRIQGADGGLAGTRDPIGEQDVRRCFCAGVRAIGARCPACDMPSQDARGMLSLFPSSSSPHPYSVPLRADTGFCSLSSFGSTRQPRPDRLSPTASRWTGPGYAHGRPPVFARDNWNYRE